MNRPQSQTGRVPLVCAFVATAVVAGLGVAVAALGSRLGWEYPSWGELVLEVAWMIGVALTPLIGFRMLEGRWPLLADLGLGDPDIYRIEMAARRPIAVKGIQACVLALAINFSLLGLQPTTAESVKPTSVALIAATFLIRWPCLVIAQQVCCFGWLQPRLGRWSLAITASLYAASHLADPLTVIYILPLGFIFAIERWQTGRVRAGIATHYLINVALFLLA